MFTPSAPCSFARRRSAVHHRHTAVGTHTSAPRWFWSAGLVWDSCSRLPKRAYRSASCPVRVSGRSVGVGEGFKASPPDQLLPQAKLTLTCLGVIQPPRGERQDEDGPFDTSPKTKRFRAADSCGVGLLVWNQPLLSATGCKPPQQARRAPLQSRPPEKHIYSRLLLLILTSSTSDSACDL